MLTGCVNSVIGFYDDVVATIGGAFINLIRFLYRTSDSYESRADEYHFVQSERQAINLEQSFKKMFTIILAATVSKRITSFWL